MDCSLPGFSIHGIFQARVLEWVAIAFSDGDQETVPPGKTCQELGYHRARDLSFLHHTVNFHWLSNFTHGNGTPLQYSCLENRMDGEAW